MKPVAGLAVLVIAGLAANVAAALLLLGLAIFAMSIAIWRQNRHGFDRLENLLTTKTQAARAVLRDGQS